MRFNDANTYLKKTFGHKMYKAAISMPVTCPNRDGRCGTGGCAFCSEGGSGEFAEGSEIPVNEQIDKAIARLSAKVPEDTGYIAYFQSFTNTYCDASFLEERLEAAAAHPKVEAISIATRPDCLPDDILGVLQRVAAKIPAAIIIFGLMGEDEGQMMASVRTAVEAGTDGVKFTCLYILKGTRIEDEWRRGEIELPGMVEYFDIVEKAFELLPPDVVVHRITGDGPKSLLLAPMWTADKRRVINYINGRFG